MVLCRSKGLTKIVGINFFVAVLIVLIIFGCKEKSVRSTRTVNKQASVAVKYYDHIQREYEDAFYDAKWRMYCAYCDSPIHIPGLEHLCFGEVNIFLAKFRDSASLKLSESKSNDIENLGCFEFSFAYMDTLLDVFYSKYIEKMPLVKRGHLKRYDENEIAGLVYSLNEHEKPLLINVNSGGFMPTGIDQVNTSLRKKYLKQFRLLYPMQPEVIYYIRVNAAKIDPWFYYEAKKRGVFDSSKYPPEKIRNEIEDNKKASDKVKHWSEYLDR